MRGQLQSHSELFKTELWDYREFLRSAIKEIRTTHPKSASYTTLSRQMGFRSRSFLQHLLRGERHLTLESERGVSSALALRGTHRKIFLNLIELAHREKLSERNSNASDQEAVQKLRQKISQLRQKAKSKIERLPTSSAKLFFQIPNAPLIYAALGAQEKGSTLTEIIERTGLSPMSCKKTLKQLTQIEAVHLKSDSTPPSGELRYQVAHEHVFEDSSQDPDAIREYCTQVLSRGAQSAKTDFHSAEKFFAGFVFSVQSERLPELKQQLKTLLSDFVVQAENADGDRVAQIGIALF